MTEVQEKELEVLKELIKVFEAHKLRWYAIGGTCLGAIRHSGFIPWDDDIDIGMPREDYEVFRKKYYKELPVYLNKLDVDTCPNYPWLFMKIHDTRTTFISDYAKGKPDIYTGAFVDIMAMDGINEISLEDAHFKKLQYCEKHNNIIRGGKFKTSFAWAKNIYAYILKKIFRYNYFSDKFEKYARDFNYDNCKYTCYSFFFYPCNNFSYLRRIIFPRELFDTIIKVNFEDIEIQVPERYDEYLKIYFGDYMKFPPLDQRNSGHCVLVCDMKKPYSMFVE